MSGELHRIGLIGGMSWQSTATYYRLLNELVAQRVGGYASAPVTVHSVDFAEIEALQRADDWPAQGRILAAAAASLQAAGVEAVALATNTLHLVSEQIVDALSVPFIDLIDLAADAVADLDAVGLLATGYTMRSDLYAKRLAPRGVDVIVPTGADFDVVHRVIFDELVHGVVDERSREQYLGVVDRLVDRGAQAVLLACTEIDMLLPVARSPAAVQLLDTTRLHCEALTEVILTGAPT